MAWMNDAFASAMPAMLRELGSESIILRRPHTLEAREEPRIIDSLLANGAFSSGASAVALHLAGNAGLRGMAPKGLVLTIGAAAYATTADAIVSGNQLVASITPVLADNVSDGATVSLAAEVQLAFTTAQGGGLKQGLTTKEIAPELLGQVSFRLSLPRQGAPGAPKRGDLCQLADGTTARVVQIERDWEGGWDLLMGAT